MWRLLEQNLQARPRMVISLGVGIVAFFSFGYLIPSSMRLLSAWDAGGLCYLALAWRMMLRASKQARWRQSPTPWGRPPGLPVRGVSRLRLLTVLLPMGLREKARTGRSETCPTF